MPSALAEYIMPTFFPVLVDVGKRQVLEYLREVLIAKKAQPQNRAANANPVAISWRMVLDPSM